MENNGKQVTEEDVKKALDSNSKKAEEIINDKDKWEKFKEKFNEFLKKAKDVPVLGTVIDDVVTMFQLVESYIKKEYTDISPTTVVSIVAALIYVSSPLDIVPDFIPVAGFVDDVAVVSMALRFGAGSDLEKYKKWRAENKKEVE